MEKNSNLKKYRRWIFCKKLGGLHITDLYLWAFYSVDRRMSTLIFIKHRSKKENSNIQAWKYVDSILWQFCSTFINGLLQPNLLYGHILYGHILYGHIFYGHVLYGHILYGHILYGHILYGHIFTLILSSFLNIYSLTQFHHLRHFIKCYYTLQLSFKF